MSVAILVVVLVVVAVLAYEVRQQARWRVAVSQQLDGITKDNLRDLLKQTLIARAAAIRAGGGRERCKVAGQRLRKRREMRARG